ncbi:MAG TPA: hypothetical protein VGP47_07805 [Parachlamydiaceae bacterium]|nr:hypothetical protein [Parachlamydiaceae bacterium]
MLNLNHIPGTPTSYITNIQQFITQNKNLIQNTTLVLLGAIVITAIYKNNIYEAKMQGIKLSLDFCQAGCTTSFSECRDIFRVQVQGSDINSQIWQIASKYLDECISCNFTCINTYINASKLL